MARRIEYHERAGRVPLLVRAPLQRVGVWMAVGLVLGLIALGWESAAGRGWRAGVIGGGALLAAFYLLALLTALGQWLWARVLPPTLRQHALRASVASWVLAWGGMRLTLKLARGHSDALVIGAVVSVVLLALVLAFVWLAMAPRSERGDPPPGSSPRPRGLVPVLAASSLWALVGTGWAAGPQPVRLGPSQPALSWVNAWTDFDLDGYGWLARPRDCQPRSPAVHPRAEDIANNGIDENCDGVDGPKPNE